MSKTRSGKQIGHLNAPALQRSGAQVSSDAPEPPRPRARRAPAKKPSGARRQDVQDAPVLSEHPGAAVDPEPPRPRARRAPAKKPSGDQRQIVQDAPVLTKHPGAAVAKTNAPRPPRARARRASAEMPSGADQDNPVSDTEQPAAIEIDAPVTHAHPGAAAPPPSLKRAKRRAASLRSKKRQTKKRRQSSEEREINDARFSAIESVVQRLVETMDERRTAQSPQPIANTKRIRKRSPAATPAPPAPATPLNSTGNPSLTNLTNPDNDSPANFGFESQGADTHGSAQRTFGLPFTSPLQSISTRDPRHGLHATHERASELQMFQNRAPNLAKFKGRKAYPFDPAVPAEGPAFGEFIESFRTAFAFARAPETTWPDIIKLYLEGPAAEFVRAFQQEWPNASWSDLLTAMRRNFTHADEIEQLQERLSTLRQTSTTRAYVEQYRRLQLYVFPKGTIAEVTLRKWFLDGLQARVRETLLVATSTLEHGPASLDKLMKLATRLELASTTATPINYVTAASAPESAEYTQQKEIRRCFNCGIPGHLQRHCRAPPRKQSSHHQAQSQQPKNTYTQPASQSERTTAQTTRHHSFPPGKQRYVQRRRPEMAPTMMVTVATGDASGASLINTLVCFHERGECVNAIIDTGAARSILSLELAKKLQLTFRLDATPLETASGTVVTPAGITDAVDFQVDGNSYRQHFLILDGAARPLLLGMDWATAANITINARERSFSVSSTAVNHPDTTSVPVYMITDAISQHEDHSTQQANDPAAEDPEITSPLDYKAPWAGEPPVSGLDPEEFKQLIGTRVCNPQENHQLINLLCSYQDVFASSAAELSLPSRLTPFELRCTAHSHSSVRAPYRGRLAPTEQAAVDKQVEEWLCANIIVKADGEDITRNNLLVVLKKDGSARVCLDPRTLNAVTVVNHTTAPWVDDVLDSLSGSSVFSALDLCSGYLQVPVHSASQAWLGFATPKGTYKFVRLPFGLRNAGAHFNQCLSALDQFEGVSDGCARYFDDLCVHAKSEVEHIKRLQAVLEGCRELRIKLNVRKCSFGAPSVAVLGYRVDERGLFADPQKMTAVAAIASPHNVATLQAFLGLCNYYRRFVPRYADMTRPLHDLTAKDSKWLWTDAHQHAFDSVKAALLSPTVLALPNWSLPFQLQCDASGIGLGVVLTQIDPQHGERPIGYFSRALTPTERRYSATERELLAIVFATIKCRIYIVGRHTEVVSDHLALRYLLGSRDVTGKLARWSLHLQQYDLTILHRPGASHSNADALSRLPLSSTGSTTISADATTVPAMAVLTRGAKAKISEIKMPALSNSTNQPQPTMTSPPSPTPMGALTQPSRTKMAANRNHSPTAMEADPAMADDHTPNNMAVAPMAYSAAPRSTARLPDPYDDAGLLHFIRTSSHEPHAAPARQRSLERAARHFSFDEALQELFREEPEAHRRMWVPRPAQRHDLIERAHLLGHFQRDATINRIADDFNAWWPTMAVETDQYIGACAPCLQFSKLPPHQHPAQALPVVGMFHRVAMDLVLGLPVTDEGFNGILVISEYLSKYPMAFPIKSKSAAEVAPLLFQYIAMFGAPKELLSDNGSEFVNEVVTTMCAGLGINKRVTTPYQPRTDGHVERLNRTLIEALEKQASESPTNWPAMLPFVLMAYRTRVSPVTRSSPFELMFGRPHNQFNSFIAVPHANTAAIEAVLWRAREIKRLVENTQPAAMANIADAQVQQRRTQDKAAGRHLTPTTLPVGTVVYIRDMRAVRKKLKPRFDGPFRVTAVTKHGNYHLSNVAGKRVKRTRPISQLKPIAPTCAERVWNTAKAHDPAFMVERIIADRIEASGQRFYEVHWQGFDEEFNSWEPDHGVCQLDLLPQYWSPLPVPPCSVCGRQPPQEGG